MTSAPEPLLPVLVQRVIAPTALAQACQEFQIHCREVLLVSATQKGIRPVQRAAEAYGVRTQRSPSPDFIQAYAPSIVDFARQHPDRLLARPGTGSPYRVIDEDTGAEYTPWADLGEL